MTSPVLTRFVRCTSIFPRVSSGETTTVTSLFDGELVVPIHYGQYHLYDPSVDYDAVEALHRFWGESDVVGTALAITTIQAEVESVVVSCLVQSEFTPVVSAQVRFDGYVDLPSGELVISTWEGSSIGHASLEDGGRHRVVVELLTSMNPPAEQLLLESHRISMIKA